MERHRLFLWRSSDRDLCKAKGLKGNTMKLNEAIQEILDTTGYSKYKLAKHLGVEPISIDNMLRGKSKGVNKAIAENLQTDFYMRLDDDQINNMEPRERHWNFKNQKRLGI